MGCSVLTACPVGTVTGVRPEVGRVFPRPPAAGEIGLQPVDANNNKHPLHDLYERMVGR